MSIDESKKRKKQGIIGSNISRVTASSIEVWIRYQFAEYKIE